MNALALADAHCVPLNDTLGLPEKAALPDGEAETDADTLAVSVMEAVGATEVDTEVEGVEELEAAGESVKEGVTLPELQCESLAEPVAVAATV
jgi:hypothetical protein